MRKYLLLMLILLLTLPVAGQEDDSESDVTLVPFVSLPLNVQGLRPDGWFLQRNADGVFIRAADPLDLTTVIMQTQDMAKDEFLDSVAISFDAQELEIVDSFESDFLTWDIYQFTREQNSQELMIDMAVAEDEASGRIYFVLLQVNSDFYESLHEQVFLPAIMWMSPIQYYEDPDGLFTVPVPLQWEVTVTDDFVQIAESEGTVVIMVTATEGNDAITSAEDFLSTINPDFDQNFNPEQHLLRVIDDPSRIGDLESVYVIDWVDSTLDEAGGFFLETVSRVYEGVVYTTAIIGNIETITDYETDIALIDNGFMITALEEALSAEATAGVDD